MRRKGAVWVLALSLLAGCTSLDASETPSAPARDVAAPSFSALEETAIAYAPPPAPAKPLDVRVTLSERWLKPFMRTEVSAVADPNARIAWFIEHDEVEPRATIVAGEVYVLKSTTPDRNDHSGPRKPLGVRDLAPDGRARALTFTTAGRYTLEAEGARAIVNVWPGAPTSAAQLFLTGAEDSLRFDPPEIDVAPGTRALFWSHAPHAVEVREAAFAAHVPLDGPGGNLTPIDEGLYRLVALAVDPKGHARGVSRTAFLVDFERPSGRLSVGPYSGDLVAPGSGMDAPRTIHVRPDHPLVDLRLRFDAGSALPLPASVRVDVLHEGLLLASASSLTSDSITLVELPPGELTIEVHGEQGAKVWYEVRAEGHYRLPTPARLLDEP